MGMSQDIGYPSQRVEHDIAYKEGGDQMRVERQVAYLPKILVHGFEEEFVAVDGAVAENIFEIG